MLFISAHSFMVIMAETFHRSSGKAERAEGFPVFVFFILFEISNLRFEVAKTTDYSISTVFSFPAP